MPLLGDPAHQTLIEFLQSVGATLLRPDAILVISAHWEQPVPTLTSSANPPLYYDYYGFPEETYRIQYPAPGDPELAQEIQSLLQNQGIPAQLDSKRGFDHGMFVPLKLMYPQADIPCVQLSLLANLNAQAHIAYGETLSSLRNKNILILGSGMSFHNIQSFFMPGLVAADADKQFNHWLVDTCSNKNLSYAERKALLQNWQQAPTARQCHPRPEHLLPLHVCFGISGSESAAAEVVFNKEVIGKSVSGFLW